ncbi:MAG: hypothetical protein OEV90_10075, partial [Gammaproteobacteria bacterium]|nr:hypothetical protein [Gammaproteobacteria bacterium]
MGALALGVATYHAGPVVPTVSATEHAVAPYIIEGRTLGVAREAVGRVGAQTTGDLAIIDAVTANLTAAQKAAIESQAGVVNVSEDVGVQTTAAASVMDRFNTQNSL